MLKPETTSTLTQGSGIHLSESCYKCSKNTFMTRSKEEQSGGTVDLAQILQTTNLVGLFGLLKTESLFYLLKGPNLPCYITSRVHTIEGYSTVPPLRSSLTRSMDLLNSQKKTYLRCYRDSFCMQNAAKLKEHSASFKK